MRQRKPVGGKLLGSVYVMAILQSPMQRKFMFFLWLLYLTNKTVFLGSTTQKRYSPDFVTVAPPQISGAEGDWASPLHVNSC